MTKRALVLGGGGSVGIAWETGLAAGLADEGIDLRVADKIVGTSAGSFVGAELACGRAPAELRARLAEGAPSACRARVRRRTHCRHPDLTKLMQFMARVPKSEAEALQLRAEIGAYALETDDDPGGGLRRLLRLRRRYARGRPTTTCTAVDALDGRFVVLDQSSRHVACARCRIELFGAGPVSADHDQRPPLRRRRHALGNELRPRRRVRTRSIAVAVIPPGGGCVHGRAGSIRSWRSCAEAARTSS